MKMSAYKIMGHYSEVELARWNDLLTELLDDVNKSVKPEQYF